jgi:general secretion pathway protein K
MRADDSRRGMVLVIVLWTIALLAVLAMAASTTFRGFAGIVAIDRDRTRADALLTAGLEMAADLLPSSDDNAANDIETAVHLSTGTVQAHLSDEGGRIDIAKAPVEVLVSLLRFIGARDAQDIARSIIDWRDPAAASRRSGVASTAVQGGDKLTAAPFTDVRMLALIPGMTAGRVAALVPLTTVFGRETVNPMTASADVLAALPGMNPERAAAILDTRRRFPTDPGRLAGFLGPAQKYLLVKPRQVVAVDLVAKLTDGFGAAAHAVITRLPDDSEPYRVLAWSPQPSS